MHPHLELAGWEVSSYAFFTMTALVVGLGLFVVIATRRGVPPRPAVAMAVAVGAGALVGARLFAAATAETLFFGGFSELFELRWGNMAMFGGLLGATGAGVVAARHLGLPALRLGDAAAPAAAVGIVVLRIGCLLAGCSFGHATALPWGITFPPGSLPFDYQVGRNPLALLTGARPVHPIQIYEIVAAALLGAAALYILRRGWRDGTAAATVAGGYALVRLAIEPLRVPEPGWTPAWFDPVLFLTVALVAGAWLARSLIRRAVYRPAAPTLEG